MKITYEIIIAANRLAIKNIEKEMEDKMAAKKKASKKVAAKKTAKKKK